jgi:hypothetical protein
VIGDIINQEKALSEIDYQAGSEEIQSKLNDLINSNSNILVDLTNEFGDVFSVLDSVSQKVFIVGNGKIFGSLKSIEVFDKIVEKLNISSDDIKLVKDKLEIRVQSDLRNAEQLLKNKLPNILRGIFGLKISDQQVLTNLAERSGQREFFDNLRQAVGEEINSVKEYEQCQNQIEVIEKEFNEFETLVKNEKLSNSVSVLLTQVGAHIEQAKITTVDQVKTVCGLVNSASALLDNAQKIRIKEKEGFGTDVATIKEDLKNINAKIINYNKEEYFRIFDLTNQAQMQIEALEVAQNKKSAELFLKEKNKFELILVNINNLIEVVEGKSNNQTILSLIVDKELLSKTKIDEFNEWCQKQKGVLAENYGVLPICLISEKISTMPDWYNNL